MIARKKYALRFVIGSLYFSLETPEDVLNLLESLEKNVEVTWKNGEQGNSERLGGRRED